jgi:hypothetical protein
MRQDKGEEERTERLTCCWLRREGAMEDSQSWRDRQR